MNEIREMSEINPQHRRLLEALLFASPDPVSAAALAERLPADAEIEALLAELAAEYTNRGVNLVKVGKGWAFRTAADLAPMLTIERVSQRRLSRAAVETLAIVAYHQPVTRVEIEEIRGVGLSKGTLDVLFEAGWIRPKGRRRTPGRPITWGTTESFLDQFGLGGLDELPGLEELKVAGLLDTRPAIQTLDKPGGVAAMDDAEEGLADALDENAVPELFDDGEGEAANQANDP